MHNTFELQDAKGNNHQYIVIPHGWDDGLDVVDALLDIGLGPVAELFYAQAMQSAKQAMPNGEASIDTTMMLKNFDRKEAVKSIRDGLKSSGGMRKIAPLILKNTHRDGEPLTGVQLMTVFPQNWGELRAAMLKIMEINGFFALLAG